jgi:hypothetical protein
MSDEKLPHIPFLEVRAFAWIVQEHAQNEAREKGAV